jgi:hypothetical protein
MSDLNRRINAALLAMPLARNRLYQVEKPHSIRVRRD